MSKFIKAKQGLKHTVIYQDESGKLFQFKSVRSYLLLVVCLSMQMCSAKNEIKYYEPVITELSGTVKMLTFPGRPNYEDIKKGDEPEKCPYLIFDHSVDVVTSKSVSVDSRLPFDNEQHVRLVQLAVGKKSLWKLMKDGMRVKVKGELFEAISGHHHTRVLMSVFEADRASSKSNLAFNKMRILCNPDRFCEASL